MSDKALPVHYEALYPTTFDGALRMGGELIKSGFLPESIKTPQQAAAIILTGLEYGWPAMRSFRLINIIKGKPTIASQGMGSMIFAAGHSYNVDALTEEHCTITFQRRGKTRPYTHKFTTDDAKAAGLLGKEMWSKYRKAMLFSRCLSAGARIEMPDVIEGFYTPEELAEEGQLVFDEEGTVVDVIDAEVTEAPERPQAAPQPKAEVKAAPAKTAPEKDNGKGAKTARPAPAEAVRTMLHNLANETFGKFDGVEPTDAHRGFLNGKLKEAGQDDQKRKLFLSYVFDAESSSELDKAQWLAIGRWLTEEKADSSGETAFREYAVAEFENVIRQAQLEQGQADMFDASVEHEHALPAEA